MIRRSINKQFNSKVHARIKFTTIRDNIWPMGVPIMLYNWSDLPYRSKQIDVAPIMVVGFWPIQIAHTEAGQMRYCYGMECSNPIWQTEGFNSREEMDDWFRPMVKRGQMITKYLMRFRLLNADPSQLGSASCSTSSELPKTMDKEYLKKAALAVHATLPDHHGFILMAIPYEGGDSRLKYISSLKREDAINVLKEWLINCGHEEDWMKHIK